MQKQLSPAVTVVIILVVVILIVAVGYFAFLRPKQADDWEQSPDKMKGEMQEMQKAMQKSMGAKTDGTITPVAPPPSGGTGGG